MQAAQALFDELNVEQPGAFELARVASFAVRVDPPLLRRLRLRLHPGLDAGIEADLWFSDIVTTRGPEGFVIDPEIAELLRRHLALEPDRYETAWQLTNELHQGLSPALQLEEEVSFLLHTQQPGAEERIVELFRSAVAALRDESRSGLAHWAARALPRFPEVVRRMDVARMLSAGAHLRLEADMSTPRPVPEDAFGRWMAWMGPTDLARIQVGVRLFPDVLEIGDPQTMEDALVLELPRTDPLLLDVAFDEPPAHDTEQFSNAAPPDQAVESQAERTFIQLRFQPGETRRVLATSQWVRLRNVLGEESILQPSLDTQQFTEQLAEAISLQDQLQVEKLCRRFIAYARYSRKPVPADQLATILDQLRRGFFAPLMEEVAHGLLESGQGPSSIRLQWIESLIDQDKLEEAFKSVQALLDETESEPEQRSAALELVGEIRKREAISESTGSPPESYDNLRYAIEAYLQAYEINPEEFPEPGIEAVALLVYAERNGVRVGEFPDPHGLAKDILRATEKMDWDSKLKTTAERFATMFQAELALGQEASALEHLRALRELHATDSFVLRTLRRQLTTVWQLGQDSEFGHQVLSMLDDQVTTE